ncbi:MAG: hypothetical protein M1812_006804 [Candelaria pacifica]|nr:MAG: hypothetical protein M1812_006804 [Candelaria pacifica]
MSSRAIRRAQQQLEEEQRAANAAAQHQNSDGTDEHEESEEEEEPRRALSKLNPFDMLNDAGDDEHDDTAEDEPEEEEEVDNECETTADVKKSQQTPTKKQGKKKKKSKAKAKVNTSEPSPENDATLLNPTPAAATISDLSPLNAVLAIETQHLHVINEMRRLFGRVVDQPNTTADEGNPEPRRRRQRGRGQAPENQRERGGLANLGWRRNIFIKGQENWPKAPSGGLSMEKVGPWSECSFNKTNKDKDAVEFRFVHNKNYQSVQQTFVLCVERSDVQGIMNILQENPYHIASLLQMSEVAKSESDHARAGDYLERALFSFGRAAHSTFSTALSSGTARLDFSRPENRELWLAAWRYIQNLGMRGTWRTAYEWTKLLLAIDPENDPYRMSLLIDQIAIRARQFEGYIKISTKGFLHKPLEMLKHHFPNILPSTALAYHHFNNVDEARTQLRAAVIHTPWVFSRLYKALNLDPIPASIWGSIAPTDIAHLLSEVYVIGSKDIWNTPENTSFLTSIVSSIDRSEVELTYMEEQPIYVTEARHTLLLHNTALDVLVPAMFREVYVSYDPLPPKENKQSYALPTSLDRPSVAPSEVPEVANNEERILPSDTEDGVPLLLGFWNPPRGLDPQQDPAV